MTIYFNTKDLELMVKAFRADKEKEYFTSRGVFKKGSKEERKFYITKYREITGDNESKLPNMHDGIGSICCAVDCFIDSQDRIQYGRTKYCLHCLIHVAERMNIVDDTCGALSQKDTGFNILKMIESKIIIGLSQVKQAKSRGVFYKL